MTLNPIKRGMVVAVSGLALAFYVSYEKASSQTVQSQEKTVEQTHKDIKVLTGQPDSQLSPIMNYFSAALGVNCAFCHVRENDKMAFDKDHEHKTIAREMVKMVQEINKNNFAGKNEVSCFTCHQGRPMPAAVPNLPLPPPLNMGAPRPAVAPGAAPAAPAAPVMTAAQIWDKYLTAVGGKDAAAKLKTRTIKGSYVTASNMMLDWDVKIDGAGKILSALKSQNMGESVNAFDGSNGWIKDQRGQRDMNPADIANAKTLIEILGVIKFKADPAEKMTMGRKTKIGDREVNVLRTTRDKKSITLFFDVETGLLVRKQEVSNMYLGRIPEQIDYEDYREVDGVKLPMTIRSSTIFAATTGTRKLIEVKHNVTLDNASFAAPPK